MKKSLKALLNALGRIEEDFPEVTDTDIRERLREAVEQTLLDPVPGYSLPDEYGLSDPSGDARVKAALGKFVEATRAEYALLKTYTDRLEAFQDDDIESRDGAGYDEYFGHVDAPE